MKFTNYILIFREESSGFDYLTKNSKESNLLNYIMITGSFHPINSKKLFYEDNEKGEVNFRKLKSRLGKKLLFGSLVKEINNLTFSYQDFNYTYPFYNNFIKILWAKGKTDIIESMFLKLYKIALKHKMCKPIRDLSLDLHNFYASAKPNNKLKNQYLQSFKTWKEQVDIFYEFEIIRIDLLEIIYTNRVTIENVVYEKNAKFAQNVNLLLDKIKDPDIYMMGTDILCFIYELENKYDTVNQIIQRAEQYCRKHNYVNSNVDWSINYNLLISTVNQGKYEDSKAYLENLYSFLTVGKKYWIHIKGIEFTIHIKTLNYSKAYETASEVYDSISKSQSADALLWQMKLAYITLIRDMLDLHQNTENVKLPDFNLKKFINNTKLLSDDKTGHNLNIKIIKVLYSLVKNDHDQAFDEIEYFGVYRSKYIKKDENARSRHFISLLLTLNQTGFHPVRVQAHAKKIIDKLSSMDYVVSTEYINTEIIQYEFLWETIIHQLRKNLNLN